MHMGHLEAATGRGKRKAREEICPSQCAVCEKSSFSDCCRGGQMTAASLVISFILTALWAVLSLSSSRRNGLFAVLGYDVHGFVRTLARLHAGAVVNMEIG